MKNAISIMNKINRHILLNLGILSLVVLVNSCKHDNFDEFVGPGHCPSKNFVYTQPYLVSATSVDLSITPLTITAAFNEAVSWALTITGDSSGAIRKYSGNSTAVNVVWNGQPGSLIFFGAETVTIEFNISCKEAITTSVNVTTPNDFTNFGVLISDFDGNGTATNAVVSPGYSATGWSSYYASPNMVAYFGISDTLTPPQGNQYITFRGQAGPASWFIGGFYAAVSLGPPGITTNNSDSVFFNAFINSNGNSTTLINITLTTSIGTFANQFILDGSTGWKLKSIKLSDFVTNKIPKGIPLSDSYLVTQISFDVQPSTAQGQPGEINMDFVIFTQGGPLYEQ